MVSIELKGKLKNGSEVYEVSGLLNSSILALKAEGIKPPYLPTPEQIVLIRLEDISANWSGTSYAPVKIKGKPTIVTANSPWLNNECFAKIAMKAQELSKYPSMPSWFYEVLEEQANSQLNLTPEDRTVHIMKEKPDSDGLIRLTSEMDDTRFLLKRFAEQYFERFNHDLISFYDLSNEIPENKTIVNYLCFAGPLAGSGLDARGRSLHFDTKYSGVLDKSTEGASKNFKYSLTDVRDSIEKSIPQICSQAKITGIEDIIKPYVEKIILRNLKRGK